MFASHTLKGPRFTSIHFNARQAPRVLALLSGRNPNLPIVLIYCAFEHLSRTKACNLVAENFLPFSFMSNTQNYLLALLRLKIVIIIIAK